MERVLITGGAGFIGSNLARHLLEAGYACAALDDLSLGRPENLPEGVPLAVGNVAEPGAWDAVEPAEVVVHLAGASTWSMFEGDLVGCLHNNLIGFTRVLEWARAGGSRRVLYASTSSLYGNVRPPLREDGEIDIPNFYSVSKYAMEQIARMYHMRYGLEAIGFRFMSVYGPREEHKGNFANLVSQFIWDVQAGRSPVIYGDGTQTRDFTNVGDIAQAIRRAIAYPGELGSAVFNVGTGRGTPLNELIGIIGEVAGRPVQAEYIPNPVKKGYVQSQIADLTRVRTTLGYEPSVSLKDGIREILVARGWDAPAPAGNAAETGR